MEVEKQLKEEEEHRENLQQTVRPTNRLSRSAYEKGESKKWRCHDVVDVISLIDSMPS